MSTTSKPAEGNSSYRFILPATSNAKVMDPDYDVPEADWETEQLDGYRRSARKIEGAE